jgi:hypothetical protein
VSGNTRRRCGVNVDRAAGDDLNDFFGEAFAGFSAAFGGVTGAAVANSASDFSGDGFGGSSTAFVGATSSAVESIFAAFDRNDFFSGFAGTSSALVGLVIDFLLWRLIKIIEQRRKARHTCAVAMAVSRIDGDIYVP